MTRKEKFFEQATKEIRDSYPFQADESYSDSDVRDIAISLAEYGYQYAKNKIVEVIKDISCCGFVEDIETEKLIEIINARMEK